MEDDRIAAGSTVLPPEVHESAPQFMTSFTSALDRTPGLTLSKGLRSGELVISIDKVPG